MIEKAFAQVSEIPVRMSRGSNALIDLYYLDGRPRHVRTSQRAQHQPRCVAAAHGHNESTSRGHSRSGFFSDDLRTSFRRRVAALEHFHVHGSHAAWTSVPIAAWVMTGW